MKRNFIAVASLALGSLIAPAHNAIAQQGKPMLKEGNKEIGLSGNAVIDGNSELNVELNARRADSNAQRGGLDPIVSVAGGEGADINCHM